MLAALLADEAVFPASPAHVPPGPSERGGRQDARRRRLFATAQAPRTAQLSLVVSEDNHTSRAHPAGGRRKPPPTPANPRNASVEKARSQGESPPIPAQAGCAMTGLSRRRSRVRVPSLP